MFFYFLLCIKSINIAYLDLTSDIPVNPSTPFVKLWSRGKIKPTRASGLSAFTLQALFTHIGVHLQGKF